jgi:acetyl esterase/lipase
VAVVVGSPQFEGFLTGQVARELGVVVVSPAYRLAPEHPFPAALDDCMATLLWMRANADEIGINPDRIAVGGASAGGGLSAAVAQRSHDEGIPLRAQVLVYPNLDDRTVLREDHGGRGRFMWTPASSRFGWTSYLGREPRLSDAPEYAAPARRSELSGLPPAWIGVGDLDLLYDEDVAYAERLRECGVPCALITVSGMYHAADAIAPKAPSMLDFRRSMLDHLKSHLGVGAG